MNASLNRVWSGGPDPPHGQDFDGASFWDSGKTRQRMFPVAPVALQLLVELSVASLLASHGTGEKKPQGFLELALHEKARGESPAVPRATESLCAEVVRYDEIEGTAGFSGDRRSESDVSNFHALRTSSPAASRVSWRMVTRNRFLS